MPFGNGRVVSDLVGLVALRPANPRRAGIATIPGVARLVIAHGNAYCRRA